MLSIQTRFVGIGALIAIFAAGSAYATTYRVDTHYSKVEVQNSVRPVTGTFQAFEGQIVYEPVQVEDSSVSFCIKANSFQVKQEDVRMGAGLFFDLSKHPEIRFESSKVVNTGDKLMVTGTLSMLGVTREVTVPVRILGRGTHPETGEAIAGFEAEMKVKLSDLGVDAWTQATGILGDSLNIRLRMVGVDQVPQAQVVRKYPEKL
jgi:polyisoprenoid-binding protein YceI